MSLLNKIIYLKNLCALVYMLYHNVWYVRFRRILEFEGTCVGGVWVNVCSLLWLISSNGTHLLLEQHNYSPAWFHTLLHLQMWHITDITHCSCHSLTTQQYLTQHRSSGWCSTFYLHALIIWYLFFVFFGALAIWEMIFATWGSRWVNFLMHIHERC